MQKRDGSEVLRGSASIGPEHPLTALDQRLARVVRASSKSPSTGIAVGKRSKRHSVTMDFMQHMGKFYPFSLNDKLNVITERSEWYKCDRGIQSPWGRPVIPMEMISVLLRHNDDNFPFSDQSSGVQLFADQEIRLISGPLFVGERYDVEHKVVALTNTRRTENCWIRTSVYPAKSDRPVAEMLLNIASFKASPIA